MDTSAQNTSESLEIAKLRKKLDTSTVPPDLRDKANTMIERAALGFKYSTQFSGFDQVASYIDWISSLPWNTRSSDNLDITHAQDMLDQQHYGLKEIKDRILEYLSVMKLNLEQPSEDKLSHNITRAPILFFVGLVGTGKTTMAISIAK